MKPPPPGWPRISSSLFYEDAPAAIDWLCRVFGFEVRLKVEGDAGVDRALGAGDARRADHGLHRRAEEVRRRTGRW